MPGRHDGSKNSPRRSLHTRGDPRCTFWNETLGLRLVLDLLPKRVDFKGDAILDLVTPGLYSKVR